MVAKWKLVEADFYDLASIEVTVWWKLVEAILASTVVAK